MKTFITILVGAFIITSCNSPESKMKTEIKTYLDKNAKDPGSYEFVEQKVTDTIIVGEFAKKMIKANDDGIKEKQESIKKNTVSLKESQNDKVKYKDTSFDEFIDGSKNDIEIASKDIFDYQKDNERLKKYLNSKEVLGYVVLHKCRMKNGLGALDIGNYYAEFDNNFKLLQFDKDVDYGVFELK